jgi:hypothetical protein
MARRPRQRNKPKAAKFSTGDFLHSVPHRNHAMRLVPLSGKAVLAEVPLRRPKYLVPPLSWVIPFSSHRRVELDATGASVLELCDGRRTVEEVIEVFARTNTLSFRESQLSVTPFLRMLAERGILAIVGPTQQERHE